MNIKIVVNGKEIDAQISEEDAQKIQPQEKLESRFVRKTSGNNYYYTDGEDISWHAEVADEIDDGLFSIGNYFTSEKQAQDHIRALKLWQAIKVFRQEREEKPLEKGQWFIGFAKSEGKLIPFNDPSVFDETTRFYKKDTTQAAIDEFYGELMWYFTEFEDD